MTLSMILATDNNGGIGINNALPWEHSKEDMAWFIRNTRGKAVVMGSKTWESLPKKPLPNRKNLILTNSNNYSDYQISVDDLLKMDEDVVVIGGASVYDLLFPKVSVIHLTIFDAEYNCDTFFDVQSRIKSDTRKWQLQSEEKINNLTFQTWVTNENVY